jgi:hypothetical protein
VETRDGLLVNGLPRTYNVAKQIVVIVDSLRNFSVFIYLTADHTAVLPQVYGMQIASVWYHINI